MAEPETLARNASEDVTGRIWLRDGDADAQSDFPEVGWLDFPVVLLATWIAVLEQLARIVPADGTVATCRFMDGPYSFSVQADEGGAWRVSCTEHRAGGGSEPGPSWLTDRTSFLDGLHRAARGVLAFCDARGWWSVDTETLRRRIEGRQGPGPG